MRPKRKVPAPVWPGTSGGKPAALPPLTGERRQSLAALRQSMADACAAGRALIATLQADLERHRETEESADVREDQQHG
jgi:hypothetical protein